MIAPKSYFVQRLASILISIAIICATSLSFAADTPYEFATIADKARYENLLEELRCLVCQNQSLADSHAELAQDLRDEVYRMISEGADDATINAFMVERYGDFVLYKPPMKSSTLLLWFGPLLFLLIAAVVLIRTISKSNESQSALSAQEREFAQRVQRGEPLGGSAGKSPDDLADDSTAESKNAKPET